MSERERTDVLKCVQVQLHVRSCGYPPFFVKRIDSGPLTTNQCKKVGESDGQPDFACSVFHGPQRI